MAEAAKSLLCAHSGMPAATLRKEFSPQALPYDSGDSRSSEAASV
jgi:hypothetical protein